MEDKAQTSFERLLLIGGAVLIAMMVAYYLKTSASSVKQEVGEKMGG